MNSLEEEQWFCLFRGEVGPMAVSVESVAEVLEVNTLVRLAWSPPGVLGLCPYHREVVPVVSLDSPPRGVRAGPAPGTDPAAGPAPAGDEPGSDGPTGCVVLFLRTEHGVWGIRVESQNTIMSRERPESLPPQRNGDGPVLIGTIRHAGTSYGILDAESTWRGLRSAVASWYGLISESRPTSPVPSREEPRAAGTAG
jgi:chemotaxis signal transduction protein